MDKLGVPISVEMLPGNKLTHQTVTNALKSSVDDDIKYDRFILVGSIEMINYPNLLHITFLGKHFYLLYKISIR